MPNPHLQGSLGKTSNPPPGWGGGRNYVIDGRLGLKRSPLTFCCNNISQHVHFFPDIENNAWRYQRWVGQKHSVNLTFLRFQLGVDGSPKRALYWNFVMLHRFWPLRGKGVQHLVVNNFCKFMTKTTPRKYEWFKLFNRIKRRINTFITLRYKKNFEIHNWWVSSFSMYFWPLNPNLKSVLPHHV